MGSDGLNADRHDWMRVVFGILGAEFLLLTGAYVSVAYGFRATAVAIALGCAGATVSALLLLAALRRGRAATKPTLVTVKSSENDSGTDEQGSGTLRFPIPVTWRDSIAR